MKRILIGLAALALLLILALALLSSQPALRFDPAVTVIGTVTPVHVRVESPHGIRRLTGWVEQDGTRSIVFESHEPPSWIFFWRRRIPAQSIAFTAGKSRAPALHNGRASVRIEAKSNDFLARTESISADVDVILEPPRVTADGFQHYISQGGSELVVFSPSGYWTEAGVRAGRYTFRSFVLPGASGAQRFSLFAFPWDLQADVAPVVYVRNPAGAERTTRFWYKLFPKQFRSRDIAIDDKFLEKVVSQIDPEGSGDLLPRFLKINSEIRRHDNQVLADLRFKTEERFLWSGPFLQLANSLVESQFADRRSYIYKGKKVDEQTHLGFDLAVTQHVAVPAANDGKIVFAENLGIYGNCIVVDHGYALQTIYGHLSEIAVKPGDMVKKGHAMGRSGSTGLAGGDHLHFSMQLDGVQISPVEWWDAHWIKDRVLAKIGPAAR